MPLVMYCSSPLRRATEQGRDIAEKDEDGETRTMTAEPFKLNGYSPERK
jgi:hypothetical protein